MSSSFDINVFSENSRKKFGRAWLLKDTFLKAKYPFQFLHPEKDCKQKTLNESRGFYILEISCIFIAKM